MTTSAFGSHMTDVYVTRKDMFPLWVFTDQLRGKNFDGNPFLCFINAYYPEELASIDESVNKRGADKLKSGEWKAAVLKEAPAGKKIGWGYGTTPGDAFRKAVYNAGYIKEVDATK